MSKKYTEEFKTTIVELYKSCKSLSEHNAKYGIAKSTISTWLKENSPVVLSYEDSITLKELKATKKEIARIKEENQILKKAMAMLAKS